MVNSGRSIKILIPGSLAEHGENRFTMRKARELSGRNVECSETLSAEDIGRQSKSELVLGSSGVNAGERMSAGQSYSAIGC